MSRAAKHFKPSALILCGGVARNKKLRRDFARFAHKIQLPSYIPSPELCTDNAAMVAALAVEKAHVLGDVHLSLDLNAYPRL